MSYSDDDCQSRFSNEQMDAIRQYLTDFRSELLNYPTPITDSIGSPSSIYPPDGTTDLASNYVPIRWNKVENATKYHLTVREYVIQSTIVVDELLDDTTYLANLNSNSNFYWQVKPISAGNSCAPYTDLINFTTAGQTVLQPYHTVNHPVCFGYNDGSISINPLGGTTPYSYQWSTGATGNQLQGIVSGNYMVTISDNASNQLILPIAVVNPPELACWATPVGSNSFQANASGGTPPYTYVWSTGEYTTQLTPPSPGNYVLTVTDDHGCLTEFPFNTETLTGIEDEVSAALNIQIYPNPNFGGMVSIQLGSALNTTSNLTIQNAAGIMVSELRVDAFTEKLDISTHRWAAGIYFINLKSETVSVQTKLLIVK